MDPPASEHPSTGDPRDELSPGQSSPRPKGRVALPVALAVVGFLLAWILTGPMWLAQINWDNGAYLASMASGKSPWESMPWNAHFGIGHVYWLGACVARLWGGSDVDGFRLADAVAFAITCALVGSAALHLAGRRLIAALITGFWMTSWVMVFLLLTLEDNILFLAPAAAVMWLCVVRLERWRLAESVAAGVAGGLAFLMSWQAILYLGPGFWAALISPGGGSLRRRLGRALAVVPAFVATLVAFCLVLASASPLHVRALVAQLFSRPTGSFGMRSVFDVQGQLRALGVATIYFAEHTAFDLPHTAVSPEFIGRQVMVGQIALLGWLTWRLWCSEWAGDRRAHLLGATLLLFTAVTPLYVDAEYRYLIRYDFVPLLAALLVACAAGALGRHPKRRYLHALALGLTALVAVQLGLGLRWDRKRRASYATLQTWLVLPHPASAWFGREGQPWYGYFRGLRERAPSGCRHVFALEEVLEGSWNFDIMGTLWSELPGHLVVGDPKKVAGWRFPPRIVSTGEAAPLLRASGCFEISADAERVLSRDAPPLE